MVKRVVVVALVSCVLATSCGGTPATTPSPTTPTAGIPTVYITIDPAGAVPFIVTFQGQTITATGTFPFNLAPGDYTVTGTFSHSVLEFHFSGGSLGRGGVKSGSLVQTAGPTSVIHDPCEIAWQFLADTGNVTRTVAVKFTVTADSLQACQ